MTEPAVYQCSRGWWWPLDDQHARPVILRDCQPAIVELLPHIDPDRRVIVQAGGNVGVYPVALTDHFAQVITCEPDPTNYACLVRNLEARDSLKRVKAFNAAFGEAEGACTPVEVHPRNCGAHRVAYDKGDVPVMTIDGLNLQRCDAIWLDVEGSELFALKGAEQTIQRCSPAIATEDKGLDAQFFGVAPGSLQAWLAERGYDQVAQIGRDRVFKRRQG